MSTPDEIFDFVIVGSGGGGMCAGLLTKAAGRTVIILEKGEVFGGTTSRSGGAMWIPNNRFLAQDGIKDSAELAMQYLDQVVGDHGDTPGATRERRLAYVLEAPKLVDFLVDQGITLMRAPYWPDYYDELPGGLEKGRAVVAKLFDANELGALQTKLRPNFIPVPATVEEAMLIPMSKLSWAGRLALYRIAWRMFTSKLLGKNYVGAGAALQGRMLKRSMETGVVMRSGADVKRILTDESGKVIGVAAVIDGKEITIGARSGVLINAGGFAHNQKMRDKYMPGTRADWSNAAPGDTGEMIQEMMRHGAAVAQMDEMIGNQMALPPEAPEIHPMVMGELAKPHSILVDRTGARYLREIQSYMQFCQEVFERNKTSPAIPSWLVMDQNYLDKYMVAGSLPGSAKPSAWYESGFLKKADTLEGLAKICGMAPATLNASVERFNALAQNGKDDDFHRGGRAFDRFFGDGTHRPSPNLGVIEKGPFYAYEVYPGDVGTYGGVVTDAHARVLREDGTVIEGLYATGTSTASVMGRAYPGPGASVGPSFVWGYVAAKHALNADNLTGGLSA